MRKLFKPLVGGRHQSTGKGRYSCLANASQTKRLRALINFVKGNDSVIGSLFEMAGIDAKKARKTIQVAWGAITSFLSKTWAVIKSIGRAISGELTKFWTKNGQDGKEALISVWIAASKVLGPLWKALSTTAKAIFGALQRFWDK